MIEVTDASLQKAAGEGMDEFIQVFTDKYKEVIGGELTAETMPLCWPIRFFGMKSCSAAFVN